MTLINFSNILGGDQEERLTKIDQEATQLASYIYMSCNKKWEINKKSTKSKEILLRRDL